MTRSLFAAAVIGIVALAAPPAATAQHTAPAGSTSTGSAVPSGGGGSSGGSSSGGSSSSSGSSGGSSDSGFSTRSSDSGRRRGNTAATGTAVPRINQPGGPITIGVGGFYPWGYAYGGGLGVGIYDGFYGDYFGAYDPWYGFSPIYAPSSSYGRNESGSIRLKVRPSDASVYVDGYYVGVVDDFDGAFQRLHLEPGPHRLEIRAADQRPLALDVWITEDVTITYRGDLKP